MGTILVVLILMLIMLKPEPRRPHVNKKKLIAARIENAKQILKGKDGKINQSSYTDGQPNA